MSGPRAQRSPKAHKSHRARRVLGIDRDSRCAPIAEVEQSTEPFTTVGRALPLMESFASSGGVSSRLPMRGGCAHRDSARRTRSPLDADADREPLVYDSLNETLARLHALDPLERLHSAGDRRAGARRNRGQRACGRQRCRRPAAVASGARNRAYAWRVIGRRLDRMRMWRSSECARDVAPLAGSFASCSS